MNTMAMAIASTGMISIGFTIGDFLKLAAPWFYARAGEFVPSLLSTRTIHSAALIKRSRFCQVA